MPRAIVILTFLFGSALVILGQQPTQSPPWAVTIAQNTTASSNISVVNQCRRNHSFQLQGQNVPFLSISQHQVQVNGGQTVNVPVRFDTQNLQIGNHLGQVIVACLSCRSEPTCTQDTEVLQVVLTVTSPQKPPVDRPQPNQTPNAPDNNEPQTTQVKNTPVVDAVFTGFLKGPCAVLETDCEKLRLIAAEKEAAAAAAQQNADAASAAASTAESNAQEAENAAKKAADAVEQEGRTSATVNGEEYTEADSDYLETLRNKNNAALAAGTITVAEHQERAKELTTKVAREERLAEQARLKQEAADAKSKADTARAEAEKAKDAADAAQKAADKAKTDAESALEDYKKCLKKVEDECLRVAAEKKRREEEAAAAAAKQADDEKRKKEADANANAAKAETAYLLDNIRQLGLITYKPKTNVPDPLDWVFDTMQKLTGQTIRDFLQSVAGQIGGGPIDPNYINALGELYKAMSSFFDVRTKAGKDRALRLLTTKIINPKTGRHYTDDEALDKIGKMEPFMRKLRDKLKEAQAEAAKQAK